MRLSSPVTLPDGRVRRGAFDAFIIALHWSSALGMLFLFASGYAMGQGVDLMLYHRSAGVALWCATLARLAWRHSLARFPPFPDSMGRLQQWAARLTEYALYAMLLLQPLSGFAQSVLGGRPFALFGITVPALLPRDSVLAFRFHTLHAEGVIVFVVCVGAHAVAALLHHYVLRDDVLETMAPWLRRAPLPRDLRDSVQDGHPSASSG
jgi:cytochrome b561